MSKSTYIFTLPIYGQLLKSFNRERIIEISRKHGEERYVRSFDAYVHLFTMLYAVAPDYAYNNYAKFKEFIDCGVVYVAKMKKNFNYEILLGCMRHNPQWFMASRERVAVFRNENYCLANVNGLF